MILPLIFFLILGTAIGSFLNVVAYRSIHGGPIFSGRSVCPHCKHTLSAADLIPVISYIALQGKCRYCKKKISAQYPIVEAAAGLGWERYVGPAGKIMSIERFGASSPYKDIFQNLGFTVDNVVKQAKSILPKKNSLAKRLGKTRMAVKVKKSKVKARGK